MTAACAGAQCVVSALNGLREAIIDRQGVLLEAAVRAGVPRFIPSDYAADYRDTRPGDNRNFDLRREFRTIADRAQIRVTSILSGAFMDLLGHEMPLLQPRIRRVLYWHDGDQRLDFTRKDDVAAYTAAAALDPTAPRVLRIAGDSTSARDLASVVTSVSGRPWSTLWVGSLGSLGLTIRVARFVAPAPGVPFPPWQGMQYLRDQFSGRAELTHLDNDRYAGIRWTRVREHVASLALA